MFNIHITIWHEHTSCKTNSAWMNHNLKFSKWYIIISSENSMNQVNLQSRHSYCTYHVLYQHNKNNEDTYHKKYKKTQRWTKIQYRSSEIILLVGFCLCAICQIVIICIVVGGVTEPMTLIQVTENFWIGPLFSLCVAQSKSQGTIVDV